MNYNSEKEYEIRFYNSNLSKKQYDEIFNNKIFESKIDKSETVIVDANNKKYEKNLLTGKIYERKKNIINKKELTNISIVYSKDSLKLSDDKIDNIKFIRYKNRTTKYIKKYKNWKFDFTIGTQFYVDSKLNNAMMNIENHEKFYQFEFESIGEVNNDEVYELIMLFIDNKIKFKIEWFFMKKITDIPTQVKSLSLQNIDEIKNNYSVTEKADGERYLILIDDNKIYKINKSGDFEFLDEIETDNMLLDTEYVDGKYYYFDILKFKNENIAEKLFFERQKILDKIKLNKNFVRKKFLYDDNIFKLSDKIYNSKYSYNLDGLIYTPTDKNYYSMSYKWKPLKDLTIDFLVKKIKSDDEYDYFDLYIRITKRLLKKLRLPIKNYMYNLFPFIKNTDAVPYLFIPNRNYSVHTAKVKKDKLKDNTIAEFNYDKEWKFYRFREDKTKLYNETIKNNQFAGPNGYHTAISNWNIIQNPITIKMITGKEDLPYFRGKSFIKSSIKSMNIFHHKVKDYLYSNFTSGDILELSGGRGGDLYSLEKIKPNKVLFIDKDKNALIEAVNKWIKIKKNKKSKTVICFQDADLNLDQSKLIIKLSTDFKFNKFSLVSCQFAFHYFYSSKKTFDNIIKTINSRIEDNGFLLLTLFDGKTVNDKLKNKDLIIGDGIFTIKKKYKKYGGFGNEIEVFGQTIGTHNEYLVDYNEFVEKMKKHNFILKESKMFSEMFDNTLKDYEKEFSGLSRYYIFYKKKLYL